MDPATPFSPTPLFAFPLFSTGFAGFEERREPLLNEILALRAAYPGVVRSNRNAWHSGEEFHRHRSEHVAWVLQKVLKFARIALAPYHDSWSRTELQLASGWANVLEPGGWNAPHHHLPCAWSGVFYVSVGQLGARPGDPSGMIEFLNPNPWQSQFGQGGHRAFAPKDGTLFLFPSSLVHFVHPHATEEVRVSIAYNFNVVPKAGA